MVVVVVMAFRLPRTRIRRLRINWAEFQSGTSAIDRKLFTSAPPADEVTTHVR